jgi:hypothetical protein
VLEASEATLASSLSLSGVGRFLGWAFVLRVDCTIFLGAAGFLGAALGFAFCFKTLSQVRSKRPVEKCVDAFV